jgi:Na+/H+ antiporter NhaA
MALQRNRPAALRRRVTSFAVGADVIAALVIGLAISATVGWIVLVIGLAIAGVIYYNFTQVMKTRGYR